MKFFVSLTLLCVAYATADLAVNPPQKPQPAITFKADKDVTPELALPDDLFVVDIPNVADSLQAGCTCNCDGQCMEKIKQLEKRLSDLEVQCDNCCKGPRPLQSSIYPSGTKTFVLRGTVYSLDDYLARHIDPSKPTYGVSGMTLDDHLGHHGVTGFECLTYAEKEQLHTALHHAGVEPEGNFTVRSIPKTVQPKATTRRSYSSGGCANGQCGRPRSRWWR